MTCKICNNKILKKNKTGYCSTHRRYSKGKKCIVCNCELLNRSKTDFCNKHRSRSGKNNAMYGKSVFDCWVEKYGLEVAQKREKERVEKTSAASKKCWENDAYREKIITGLTGKKRTQEFKDLQKKNAIDQMKDPKQREIRSTAIKKSWIAGTHDPDHISLNAYGKRGFTEDNIFYASKIEHKRINFLNESLITWKRYSVNDFEWRIKYTFEGSEHLYLPDFVIFDDDKIIIEEVKYDLKRLTERELIKRDAAITLLSSHNIYYRIIDDPRHSIRLSS